MKPMTTHHQKGVRGHLNLSSSPGRSLAQGYLLEGSSDEVTLLDGHAC